MLDSLARLSMVDRDSRIIITTMERMVQATPSNINLTIRASLPKYFIWEITPLRPSSIPLSQLTSKWSRRMLQSKHMQATSMDKARLKNLRGSPLQIRTLMQVVTLLKTVRRNKTHLVVFSSSLSREGRDLFPSPNKKPRYKSSSSKQVPTEALLVSALRTQAHQGKMVFQTQSTHSYKQSHHLLLEKIPEETVRSWLK